MNYYYYYVGDVQGAVYRSFFYVLVRFLLLLLFSMKISEPEWLQILVSVLIVFYCCLVQVHNYSLNKVRT